MQITCRLMMVAWLFASGVSCATAAELRASVLDQHGKPLADAVVLATPDDSRKASRTAQIPDAVDQIDKQFVPFVNVIRVGAKVWFPNKDHIRHQVYSFSSTKKFELPLYAGTPAEPVVFDKPGVVILGCNIHDWMIGYVYVTETPFFAKTDRAGNAVIADMPPGDYNVRVWHPYMSQTEESTGRQVTITVIAIPAAEQTAWRIAVQPALRVPRVSDHSGLAYP